MSTELTEEIGAKLNIGRYVLCWLEVFFSTILLTVFWFITGLLLNFSDSSMISRLDSAEFFTRYESETFVFAICKKLKSIVGWKSVIALLITIAVLVVLLIVRWRICEKNSLVFMRFTSAVLLCGGIITALVSFVLLVSGFYSNLNVSDFSVKSMFKAFAKSSLFTWLAIALIITAVGFLCNRVAKTIEKNRTKSYKRKMSVEEGL